MGKCVPFKTPSILGSPHGFLNPVMIHDLLQFIAKKLRYHFFKNDHDYLNELSHDKWNNRYAYCKEFITLRLQPYVNLYITHAIWISMGTISLNLVFCLWIKGLNWLAISKKVHSIILKFWNHCWSSYLITKNT